MKTEYYETEYYNKYDLSPQETVGIFSRLKCKNLHILYRDFWDFSKILLCFSKKTNLQTLKCVRDSERRNNEKEIFREQNGKKKYSMGDVPGDGMFTTGRQYDCVCGRNRRKFGGRDFI